MADAEHGFSAALRLDFHRFVVAEDHRADTVTDLQRTPRPQRRDFRGGGGFGRSRTAKEHRCALIDDQQHGPLAFFAVDPDMRLSQTGGGPPVDRTDVIAGAVIAQFLESQPAASQPRRVPAAEQTVHRLARQQRETLRVELQPDQMVERRVNARRRI